KTKFTPLVRARGIPAHSISRPRGGARTSRRERAERLCPTSPNASAAATSVPAQSMRRSGLAIADGRRIAPGGEARIQQFGRIRTECRFLRRPFQPIKRYVRDASFIDGRATNKYEFVKQIGDWVWVETIFADEQSGIPVRFETRGRSDANAGSITIYR